MNNPFDSNIDKCDLISLWTGLSDRTGECNPKTAKKLVISSTNKI